MSPELVTASTIVQMVVYGLLFLKLCRTNLARVYRYFAALLVFEFVRVGASSLLPRHTTAYAWFYFATEPLLWALSFLVTLEIYKSVFRSLPGISRFTHYVILTATGIAVLLAALSLTLQSEVTSQFRILEIYLTLERTIFVSLLTFVLLLAAFLSWYPVPVHRNAVIYSGVFAIYFGVKTGAFLLRTLGGPGYAVPANIAVIVASALSGILWIALLTEAGEIRRARPLHRMSPEDEEKLLTHLQSINRTLLGSVPD
jgi:hypothetical protein